ncbi:MAG: alpha/beta hydrolase, partial [Idiomarinaceae bacterium]|nr:alpha/beta hydrolase [Idiomarinaceae bacterium]
MSNQYLDFWSKRPLPDYPEIKDMPVTVIASVRTVENPPNLFFTEQGRKMWGELWQAWANAFPQGKSVLTEKSGHFVQFDEPDLVLSELLALMQRL